MNEKFKLLKDLGGGAFGRTYKVEIIDTSLRNKWGDVAVIKVPHNKSKEKTLIEELVKYEILFQNLDAQYIVKYLGFDLFHDQYVMIMEYFDGSDLDQVLRQRSPLGINEVIEISEKVAMALLEAHRARIFHRDIKPSNILVDATLKKVKVTDLGVSRFIREDESAHTMTGTLPYMAPEIISGGGGFHSDIYSLSVTMYEMLTGELPISGKSIEELIYNIQNLKPKPPVQLRSDIPQRLNDIILKGLEKDPSKRFKTVEEILLAIQQLKPSTDIKKELDKAWKIFRSGNIKESEKIFREIIQKYPNEIESYLNTSEFYNRCANYDISLRVLKKGLKYNPTSGIIHWNIAMIYKQIKMELEARQTLEKALKFGLTEKMQHQGKIILELWNKSK